MKSFRSRSWFFRVCVWSVVLLKLMALNTLPLKMFTFRWLIFDDGLILHAAALSDASAPVAALEVLHLEGL